MINGFRKLFPGDPTKTQGPGQKPAADQKGVVNDPVNTSIKATAKRAFAALKAAAEYINPLGWQKHTLSDQPKYGDYLMKKIGFNLTKMQFYRSHFPIGDVILDHALQAAGNPTTIEEKFLVLEKLKIEDLKSAGESPLAVKLKQVPPEVATRFNIVIKLLAVAKQYPSVTEKEACLDWLVQVSNSSNPIPHIPEQIKNKALLSVMQKMYNNLVVDTENKVMLEGKEVTLFPARPLLAFLTPNETVHETAVAGIANKEAFQKISPHYWAQLSSRLFDSNDKQYGNRIPSGSEVEKVKVKKQEQFMQWGEKLKWLSPTQIRSLSPELMDKISAQVLEKWSPEQIQALSLEQIGGMEKEQLNSLLGKMGDLSWEQLQTLDPRVASLPTDLAEVTKDKMYPLRLAVLGEQARRMQGVNDASEFAKIPPTYFAQVQLEPKPLGPGFDHIPNEQWGGKLGWLTPEQLRAIPPNMIPHIPIAAIQQWNEKQVGALTSGQLLALTPEQRRGISLEGIDFKNHDLTPELICLLPPEQLQDWSVEEVEGLSAPQLNALTDEQMAVLSVNDLTLTQLSQASLACLQKVMKRAEVAAKPETPAPAQPAPPDESWGLVAPPSSGEKEASGIEPLSERQQRLVTWCLQMADENAPIPEVPDLGKVWTTRASDIGLRKLVTQGTKISKFKKLRRQMLTKEERQAGLEEFKKVSNPALQNEMQHLRHMKFLQVHGMHMPTDPDEIKALPLRHIGNLLRSQVDKLTPDQIYAMTPIQIGALYPAYLTEEKKKVITERLKQDYRDAGGELKKDPNNADALKDATNAFKLLVRINGGYDQRAEERTVIEQQARATLGIPDTKNLTPLRISLLTPNEMSEMKKEELEALKPEQAALLTLEQVGGINKEVLLSLQDSTKPIHTKKLELIDDAIARYEASKTGLSDKDIAAIDAKIEGLTMMKNPTRLAPSEPTRRGAPDVEEKTAALSGPIASYKMSDISPTQIEKMTNEQLGQLTKKQYDQLTNEQKRAFTVEQLTTIFRNTSYPIHANIGDLIAKKIELYKTILGRFASKEEKSEEDIKDIQAAKSEMEDLVIMQGFLAQETTKIDDVREAFQSKKSPKGGMLDISKIPKPTDPA